MERDTRLVGTRLLSFVTGFAVGGAHCKLVGRAIGEVNSYWNHDGESMRAIRGAPGCRKASVIGR